MEKMNIYLVLSLTQFESNAVADPGFPVGGAVHPLGGGRGPPKWALFSENVCKNERIGSHRGGMRWAHPLDLPMQCIHIHIVT